MTVMVGDLQRDGLWVKCYRKGGIQYRTKASAVWSGMLARCKNGGREQEKYPTYIGCTSSENFKDFQFFTTWYSNQHGYGLKDYHLDKDILVEGNKVYSEDTCVLVPSALNKFLLDHRAARGKYPQGVHFSKVVGKFAAQISRGRKSEHIGYFNDVLSASLAYKHEKVAEARRWYERLEAGEFIVDPRVIERMRTWTFTAQGGVL